MYLNPHQSRDAEPTVYEDQLADALEFIFSAGVTELSDIALKLEEMCVPTPGVQHWTEEALRGELARLAG